MIKTNRERQREGRGKKHSDAIVKQFCSYCQSFRLILRVVKIKIVKETIV